MTLYIPYRAKRFPNYLNMLKNFPLFSLQAAKHEWHSSTPVSNPDRFNPTRVGIVFYQHRNLHFPFHGYNEYLAKQHEKNERDFEAWKLGKFDI